MGDAFGKEELKNNRIQRRVYELLSKAAASGASHPSSGQRELHFVFFRKPDRFLESDERSGYVSGISLEKSVLKGNLLYQMFVFLKITMYLFGNKTMPYMYLHCSLIHYQIIKLVAVQ